MEITKDWFRSLTVQWKVFNERSFKSTTSLFLSWLGIIAAGTNRGHIAFWTYTPNRRTTDVEKHWVLQRAKQLAPGVAVRYLKVERDDRRFSSFDWEVSLDHIHSTVYNGIVWQPISCHKCSCWRMKICLQPIAIRCDVTSTGQYSPIMYLARRRSTEPNGGSCGILPFHHRQGWRIRHSI